MTYHPFGDPASTEPSSDPHPYASQESARLPSSAVSAPCRIWIVEDHQLFRQLLGDYLRTISGITITGESEDDGPLFAHGVENVDVIVLDLNLKITGGMRILEKLQRLRKSPAVMILSACATEHAVHRALQLGARAYVDKTASLDEIRVGLEQISSGGVYFSETVRRALIKVTARSRGAAGDAVTERETVVLSLIAAGAMVKEVASELNLSKWAIYRVRGELRRKLDLRSDRELIDYAARIGLAETLPSRRSEDPRESPARPAQEFPAKRRS